MLGTRWFRQLTSALRKDTRLRAVWSGSFDRGTCLLLGGFGNEWKRQTLKDTEGH